MVAVALKIIVSNHIHPNEFPFESGAGTPDPVTRVLQVPPLRPSTALGSGRDDGVEGQASDAGVNARSTQTFLFRTMSTHSSFGNGFALTPSTGLRPFVLR